MEPAPAELRRLGHVPSLDSLRAVAVLLVLVAHLAAILPVGGFDARFSRSGFLGVDLFFVLSGFLITSILLQEQHRHDRIRLAQFYARRALRLLPALVFLFVVYGIYSQATDWPPFGRRDFFFDNVEATALYYMNWRVLWNPLGAADMTAIWSLSIEEQFYLVWPFALAAFLGWRHPTRRVVVALTVGAVVVSLWRAVVFQRWGWEAAYLRTDTRIDGLLWGALAASLFARGLTPRRLPRWTPAAAALVGAVALVVVKGDRGTAYFGGISAWVLASCALVLYLASDPERWSTGTLADISQRIGRVSYGLYLWQLPAFRAISRWGDSWPAPVRTLAGLALLVGCTLTSWFLVEQPVLRAKRRLQDRWEQRRSPTPAATTTT